LHRNGDQPIQLVVGRTGQQRFGPEVILARRMTIEQPSKERDERDSLELRAASRVFAVITRAEQRLEAVRVAKRLGRERRDHLAETDITLGERIRLALRAQEDRADDRGSPSDGHDDDRADIADVERGARVLQERVVRRVGDEHRVTGLERPLELRVTIEVDDEVPDGRVFVARDEPHFRITAREVDRAAIQAEGLAQLAGDGLQNVYEMERGRNVLQDVDDRDELITLALKLRDPLPQLGRLRLRLGIALDR